MPSLPPAADSAASHLAVFQEEEEEDIDFDDEEEDEDDDELLDELLASKA